MNYVKKDVGHECDTGKTQCDQMEQQGVHMIGVSPCDTSGYDPKLVVDCTSALTFSSGAEVAAAAIMRVRQRQLPSSQATPESLYVPSLSAMRYPPPIFNTNYSVPPPSVSYGFGIDTSVPLETAAKPAQQHPPPVQNGIVGIVSTPRGVMPQYVTPYLSTFQYEPTADYLRDPITHFYYDVKTMYFYNSDTRQWMYYDSTYSTYFPAHEEESTAPAEENMVQDFRNPDDPKLDDSKKSTSAIANEMHKWAKKEDKPLIEPLETVSAFDSMASYSTSCADPAKILDKLKLGIIRDESDEDDSYKKQSSNEKIDHPPATNDNYIFFTYTIPPMNVGNSGSYVEPMRQRALPSAEQQCEIMERPLIDEANKICLLCKRPFPSDDVLRKEVEKNDLRKKNLEEKRVEWGQQYMTFIKSMGEDKPHVSEPAPKRVCGNWLKNRLKKFGIGGSSGGDVTPGASKTKEEIRNKSEEAIRSPIDSSNIGYKLLKTMGWKEGQGAGKTGQGIINPIEAERRVECAGLGFSRFGTWRFRLGLAHGAKAPHRKMKTIKKKKKKKSAVIVL